MAYYDLMSFDSYGHFNRKLAHLTSLSTAVYWSEILLLIPQIIKEKKYEPSGYFKLNREYIESRTSISIVDQLANDMILENLGVLARDTSDTNLIGIKLDIMEQLLIDDHVKATKVNQAKVKVSREQAALNKKAYQISTMKRYIFEEDAEIKEKYFDWIESVYSSNRFLTKSKIETFMSTLNQYTEDKTIKLKILSLGIQTGWDNADWLINKYKNEQKGYTKATAQVQTASEQRLSTGINEKFEF